MNLSKEYVETVSLDDRVMLPAKAALKQMIEAKGGVISGYHSYAGDLPDTFEVRAILANDNPRD